MSVSDYMRRMGWSHITPDGWISLSHCYKRNIVGRVIASEDDPTWRRDIQLALPRRGERLQADDGPRLREPGA